MEDITNQPNKDNQEYLNSVAEKLSNLEPENVVVGRFVNALRHGFRKDALQYLESNQDKFHGLKPETTTLINTLKD